MKTLLFFLVIGFSLCTAGKAQTSLVSTREKFRHHEISVSYGFLPITDANSIDSKTCCRSNKLFGYTIGVGNRGTASSLYEVLDENKNDDRRYLYILTLAVAGS